MPVFVLAASSAVCAQDWGPSTTGHRVDRYQWLTVDANMSSEEYEVAYRRNLRLVRNTLKSYSKDALTSMGVPEVGINFMSAAVGLAVHDARFHLNESKTLALELKDVANDDRTLFLGVKVDW
jgi:hypothetical protein